MLFRSVITDHFEWDYYWEDPEDEHYHEWYAERGYDVRDVIPSPTVHGWTYLYAWLKELRGHAVTVAGGLRGECLLDLDGDALTPRRLFHAARTVLLRLTRRR